MRLKHYKAFGLNNSRGFSLVEILVVLVIIGLLAGFVLPNVLNKLGGAQVKAAKTGVVKIDGAITEYYLDNGQLPNNLEDLVKNPGDADFWNGPYVKESQLKDPWGNQYVYQVPGEHGEFDIISYGADKSPGGEGKNADIGSWQ